MAPINNSSAWVVVKVVFTDGAVLCPAAPFVLSVGLGAASPANSLTLSALAPMLKWEQVIVLPLVSGKMLWADRTPTRTPDVPEPLN
jgi:hypothetical protein